MNKLIVALFAFMLVFSVVGANAASMQKTADPGASQATQNVLTYLQNVVRRSNHRIVTGQQAMGESDDLATEWASWVAVCNLTGTCPGLLGGDYGEWNTNNPAIPIDFNSLNNYLAGQWNAGSLIEISYHANNPFVSTNNYWSNPACNGGTLADLINPATSVLTQGTSTSVYTTWHNQLALTASHLQDLQSRGVVVIWRPFPEQNASPWWWLTCNPTVSQVAAVWQDMFNVFTNTYKLHNLLWAYSSNKTNQNGCGASFMSGLCQYPGAAYVDIVGIDDYRDGTGPMPDFWGENWFRDAALGKIIALTERGPAETDGTSLMYQTLISGLISNRNGLPIVSFFMAWGSQFGMAQNLGGAAVLADANSANQPDVARVMACMNGAATYAARVACVGQ